MSKLTKEQYVEYQLTLHMGRNDAVGIALTALLEHDYERVKDLLVSAESDFAVLQGEAQAYRKYLKVLKEFRKIIPQEI